MFKNWTKYLLLLWLIVSILPVAAMNAPLKLNNEDIKESNLIQPQHLFTPELAADPLKWNNWLSDLINIYFGKPYKGGDQGFEERTISDQKYIVYRPNHALAHGMRQGFLAVNMLDGFEYIHPNDFTSPDTAHFIQWVQMKLKTDPYFRQKIQFTAAFQRTGRESEDNFHSNLALYQQYELQDSENFYNAAKNFVGPNSLFKDDDELKLYKQSILKKSDLKDTPYPPNNKELQYLRKIIWTSHTLDLRRLIHSGFNESTVIANATVDLFGPTTAFVDPNLMNSLIYPEFKKEGNFVKKLWEYSGNYLQATGDRYDGKFEDKFFIQAKNPDKMVKALIEANNSIRSAPYPTGIFLYSACPVKMKQPISIKSRKTATTEPEIIKIEPQTSYEWCVLLMQRKDGSYGTLGGAASPFEDEADAARRRVQEESGFIYDIDPATFDRKNLAPLEGESLQQLRERRSHVSQPSTAQNTSASEGTITGEEADYTMFFKEVPFYEAQKFLEARKNQGGILGVDAANGYAWVPVRNLIALDAQNSTVTPGAGFYAFLDNGTEQEMANQPAKLNISLPFIQLLGQKEVKEYLQDKIIEKPIPTAIINKMQANIELKDLKNVASQSAINPNAFTMFDKYAQDILGNKVGNSQSNLEHIIEKHNNEAKRMLQLAEQYPHHAAEYLFYHITPDIQNTLLQMVNKEKALYPWFVFYHAVPSNIYQVYEICREFRSLITGKSLKENQILRGLDDAFSIIQNIEDFYQKAAEEYEEGGVQTLDKTKIFRKQGLSVNMTLFGGLQEALDSGHSKAEYSIYRWMGAYSDIDNPNIARDLIVQFLSNFGIPQDRAKRYQDLHDEYFPSQTIDGKNLDDIKNIMQQTDKRKYGVMLQLFINPQIIDQVAYLAEAGGKKLTLPSGETLQQVLMKIRSKSEDGLFKGIQTRLFLKPEYFHDPQYVKTFSYFSKNLDKSEKEYHEKLKKLVTEDLAFLLSSNALVTKEGVGESQPLLELHERVTGNIREQTGVPDQKVVDWFAAKQTEAIRTYYDKNPKKVNTPLKNIHNLSYGHDEIKTPASGYIPIQLSLMYKNQELFLYFLDKLDEETQKTFLEGIIPIQSGYMTRHLDPLGALAFVDFNLKEVVPKLYEKLGGELFDYLFLTEEVSGIAYIMEAFDSIGSIPLHYLENLFSKPSYLRGLEYIKKITLSEEQATFVLNKTFDDLWSAFKAMSFFAGENLSTEDQRYYNILFKGAEKNYQYMVPLFFINKFTFSYFETFLHAIHFEQFSEDLARAVFINELKDDFIERSVKSFLNLVKANLKVEKPQFHWRAPPNPVWKLQREYEKTKAGSLNENDKLIFGAYGAWLSKFIKY